MRSILLAGALALVALAPSRADGLASLIVKVEKVSPKGGDIRVALYDEKSYPDDDAEPVKDAVAPAKVPETIVVMKDIPPGLYAVKLFQDFNRNGRFDMTWLGMPIEKFGFSNDARPIFAEPGFDRTKFKLSPGANTIIIHLQ